jgi:hypothetical protein
VQVTLSAALQAPLTHSVRLNTYKIMAINWTNTLMGFLGGGFGVKLIDFFLKELRTERRNQINAKNIIDKHLDPILKSTDELVGKIRSLAASDFKELKSDAKADIHDFDTSVPYLNIVYLFAQFWARIQILRIGVEFNNVESASGLLQLTDKRSEIPDHGNPAGGRYPER